MEKAVRSGLHLSAPLVAVLLAGCAQPARDLPPDMSSLAPSQRLLPGDTSLPEYQLSCPQLQAELKTTRNALTVIEAQLQSAQGDNQSKGVAGLVLFTPILLAMDDNAPVKARYRDLDEQRERLLRIGQARQCAL